MSWECLCIQECVCVFTVNCPEVCLVKRVNLLKHFKAFSFFYESRQWTSCYMWPWYEVLFYFWKRSECLVFPPRLLWAAVRIVFLDWTPRVTVLPSATEARLREGWKWRVEGCIFGACLHHVASVPLPDTAGYGQLMVNNYITPTPPTFEF